MEGINKISWPSFSFASSYLLNSSYHLIHFLCYISFQPKHPFIVSITYLHNMREPYKNQQQKYLIETIGTMERRTKKKKRINLQENLWCQREWKHTYIEIYTT